jgi:hypothetical protein
MRDPHEPLARYAVRSQLLDGAVGLHDDPADCRKRLAPRAQVPLLAREDVVRGQHGRVARGQPAQPMDVVARDREPLHVHDIGAKRTHAMQQAQGARPVLEPLQHDPRPAPRRAAEQPRRERQEDLLAPVAVGLGHVAVREGRGEQRDVVAAPGERRCERMVVGRREARRVEDRDVQKSAFGGCGHVPGVRGASQARTQGASIAGPIFATEDDAWRRSSRVRDLEGTPRRRSITASA